MLDASSPLLAPGLSHDECADRQLQAHKEKHGTLRHEATAKVLLTRSVLVGKVADGTDDGAGASVFDCCLNLTVASAGGVGMVTLPGAYAAVGYAEGLALLLLCGLAAAYSLSLLDRACRALGDPQPSYAGVVAHSLGKPGSYALEALTLVYCLGQTLAYLGAIGSQVSSLLPLLGLRLSVVGSTCAAAAAAVFPLSLLPDASGMRFAGAVGTAMGAVIILIVLLGDGAYAAANGACSRAPHGTPPAVAYSPSLLTLLSNFPIFLFAMNGSTAFVPVRRQLSHGRLGPSQAEAEAVISWPLAIAGLSYLTCAAAAYYAYCGAVPENAVDAWPGHWAPGVVARLGLTLQLSMTAAGIYVPLGRAALWHLMEGPEAAAPSPGVARKAATAGLVALPALGAAALGGALALPLAATSALCVTAQMLVLPGLCCARIEANRHARLIDQEAEKRCGGPRGGMSYLRGVVAPLGFAAGGAAVGVLSLVALFGLL